MPQPLNEYAWLSSKKELSLALTPETVERMLSALKGLSLRPRRIQLAYPSHPEEAAAGFKYLAEYGLIYQKQTRLADVHYLKSVHLRLATAQEAPNVHRVEQELQLTFNDADRDLITRALQSYAQGHWWFFMNLSSLPLTLCFTTPSVTCDNKVLIDALFT